MILLGPLIIVLPRGTLVWTIALFLGAVIFAIGVLIVVSTADADRAHSGTPSRYTGVTTPGYRTCEPFCGAAPGTATSAARP
ncbi:hypothetical protein BJY24_003195 [Nocardia transvalensis]|uniref:Uncharacterized protein n=1 Tax=Nocardia transvalensis TaxID=37333 RepID=A0A7W9UIE5_9NOCA|nr:hypothetical protein [Nocardia transvalensis]MBB5914328.1 hypothetical protein [Nocardia transvalensis]